MAEAVLPVRENIEGAFALDQGPFAGQIRGDRPEDYPVPRLDDRGQHPPTCKSLVI